MSKITCPKRFANKQKNTRKAAKKKDARLLQRAPSYDKGENDERLEAIISDCDYIIYYKNAAVKSFLITFLIKFCFFCCFFDKILLLSEFKD